jgi:hypothetical protein
MTAAPAPPAHTFTAVPTPAELLAQMNDIRGLDKISAWPPGPGWWIILGILIAVAFYAVRRYRHARSWKGDALRALETLESRITGANSRDVASELAATLRRIAITRHSRSEAAGLEGERWLEWLRQHDPKGFNWTKDGRLLIDAPYTPPGTPVLPDRVRTLVQAAKAWVK